MEPIPEEGSFQEPTVPSTPHIRERAAPSQDRQRSRAIDFLDREYMSNHERERQLQRKERPQPPPRVPIYQGGSEREVKHDYPVYGRYPEYGSRPPPSSSRLAPTDNPHRPVYWEPPERHTDSGVTRPGKSGIYRDHDFEYPNHRPVGDENERRERLRKARDDGVSGHKPGGPTYYDDPVYDERLNSYYRNRSVRKGAVAVSVTPLDPQDVTVYMSMDVTENLEDSLEELARLRRLGNFKAALDQFDHLKPFLDQTYVRVQYGEFLLKAKRFSELDELAQKHPPTYSKDLAEMNWRALLWIACSSSDLDFGGVEDCDISGVAEMLLEKHLSNLGSTELQCLLHMFDSDATNGVWETNQDFYNLHHILLSEERLWELLDVLLILGCDDVDLASFSHEVQNLADSSDTEYFDESSAFAFLEIFTVLALDSMGSRAEAESIKYCLDAARKQAKALLANSAHNLKTLPYLRFLMAEVQIVIFGLFVVTAVLFHYKLSRNLTTTAASGEITWQRYLHVRYGASFLILVRSIFRVIEYLQGNGGYLISHEMFLYLFDAVPMAAVMGGFLIWYVEALAPRDSYKQAGHDVRDTALQNFA
ncbi:hypothetical protein QQX98_006358 [Neonectria punicea]|uniref:Uncharacterized protein n=1 Tax=Neonectria punicea TaxID=979145 RepID=A0ABR1H1L2_9HYPO